MLCVLHAGNHLQCRSCTCMNVILIMPLADKYSRVWCIFKDLPAVAGSLLLAAIRIRLHVTKIYSGNVCSTIYDVGMSHFSFLSCKPFLKLPSAHLQEQHNNLFICFQIMWGQNCKSDWHWLNTRTIQQRLLFHGRTHSKTTSQVDGTWKSWKLCL